jgi:hypothetical protein
VLDEDPSCILYRPWSAHTFTHRSLFLLKFGLLVILSSLISCTLYIALATTPQRNATRVLRLGATKAYNVRFHSLQTCLGAIAEPNEFLLSYRGQDAHYRIPKDAQGINVCSS